MSFLVSSGFGMPGFGVYPMVGVSMVAAIISAPTISYAAPMTTMAAPSMSYAATVQTMAAPVMQAPIQTYTQLHPDLRPTSVTQAPIQTYTQPMIQQPHEQQVYTEHVTIHQTYTTMAPPVGIEPTQIAACFSILLHFVFLLSAPENR
jgi:hypothetical protein